MDSSLRKRLQALNRHFYSANADRFVARRQHPWPGWTRTLDVLQGAGFASRPRVFEVGCGHGRFAAFLAEQGYSLRYLGADTSCALLARAQERRLQGTRYLCADGEGAVAPGSRFDLVAAFGLLHHIPGHRHRLELVAALARRLAPGGHLVLTLWSPDARRRARASPVVGGDPGDVLLPWGAGESAPVRYCHCFDRGDEAAFVDLLGGSTMRFRADGRGGENLYLIHRRGAKEDLSRRRGG